MLRKTTNVAKMRTRSIQSLYTLTSEREEEIRKPPELLAGGVLTMDIEQVGIAITNQGGRSTQAGVAES